MPVAMRRQPDLTIIFLNILSAVGAVAWIQYIESGGGNANAGKVMLAMASLSVMSGLMAIYRRRVWIAKGLLKPDEDGRRLLVPPSLCNCVTRDILLMQRRKRRKKRKRRKGRARKRRNKSKSKVLHKRSCPQDKLAPQRPAPAA
jgi:hypothetical protein